jgi:HD-GYP domain-containing protein (c-di-GMP phosphodiesterase class II)
MLALTTIKEFDDYLMTHSANVAILAVAVGERAGLPKTQLGQLCLAAFLHDLGKTAVSREILDKPGLLTAEDRLQIEQHPLHGVHILLGQDHLTQPMLRAIVGGYEHHLNYDMTGYPRVTHKRSLTLFGRIIGMCDRYDAITTPRPYRQRNFTPYEGVRYLMRHTGTQFDPLLVRVFLELVGLYPPGTVVGLADGLVGVVCRAPLPGSPIDRPLVRVIRGAGTDGAESETLLDLAEPGEDGSLPLGVREVHNPGNAGQLPAVHPAELKSA